MDKDITLTMEMVRSDGSMSAEDSKIAGAWLNEVLQTATFGATDTWTTYFFKKLVNDLDEETLKVCTFMWLKGLLNERNN